MIGAQSTACSAVASYVSYTFTASLTRTLLYRRCKETALTLASLQRCWSLPPPPFILWTGYGITYFFVCTRFHSASSHLNLSKQLLINLDLMRLVSQFDEGL